MKTIALSLSLAALALSACTTTPGQNTALGALAGAAVGTAVSSDGDKLQGALTGAALGAVAGTVVGQNQQTGKCYYADGRGGTYIAPC